MYHRNDYLDIAPTQLVPKGMIKPIGTSLALDNIAQSRAYSRMDNGLTRALDFGGMLAQQLGSQIMSMGVDNQMKKAQESYKNGSMTKAQYNKLNNSLSSMSTGLGFLNNIGTSISQFALGGSPSYMGEVEGGEVIEYPNGSMVELSGASHEDGGMVLPLPHLAQVYSDRIKIDGVSIADRNKKREKRNASLSDILKLNPYDHIVKKSWERGTTNSEKLKRKEQELQSFISNLLR